MSRRQHFQGKKHVIIVKIHVFVGVYIYIYDNGYDYDNKKSEFKKNYSGNFKQQVPLETDIVTFVES